MYLLETSALLRATVLLNEPLGAAAEKVIKSSSRKIYISLVSLWEIAVLEKSGKIILTGTPESYFKSALKDLNCKPLPLAIAHINEYQKLNILTYSSPGIDGKQKNHTDPFDRMLIAQAIKEKATIISKDEVFPLYKGVNTIWY
jgi:PIN domain nuclease of toxin-antitoxin system